MEVTESPRVTLYALSTCVWCKMTRTFLDDNNVQYECVYVDLLDGEEKDKIMEELQDRLGCRPSFPTVFCGEAHVTGFKKDDLKELLGI